MYIIIINEPICETKKYGCTLKYDGCKAVDFICSPSVEKFGMIYELFDIIAVS